MIIEKTSGAYIYEEFGIIGSFFYIKLAKNELKKHFDYEIIPTTSNYLIITNYNSHVYNGHMTYNDLIKIIEKKNMHSLLENDFSMLKKLIPKLTFDEYKKHYTFAKNQLDILNNTMFYGIIVIIFFVLCICYFCYIILVNNKNNNN